LRLARRYIIFFRKHKTMKRPWLTTTTGQRWSIVLSAVVSAAIVLALIGYWILQAAPRTEVKQLDPTQIDYCHLDDCLPIDKLAGLELVTTPEPYKVLESEQGTIIQLRFVNHGRLEGTRELRLVLQSANGKIVEDMSQEVSFLQKGPVLVEFLFTGFLEELQRGNLQLGY
jgi:multidrug efflux pump subunit AcrA (membrane-fusion protein)